jgi:hypothetical protein
MLRDSASLRRDDSDAATARDPGYPDGYPDQGPLCGRDEV